MSQSAVPLEIAPGEEEVETQLLLVRGADADIAKAKLRFSKKGASAPLLTLLNSAVSNAANNFKKKEGLYIKKIFVDQVDSISRMM
jgi:large subunit ribosomal protein L22